MIVGALRGLQTNPKNASHKSFDGHTPSKCSNEYSLAGYSNFCALKSSIVFSSNSTIYQTADNKRIAQVYDPKNIMNKAAILTPEKVGNTIILTPSNPKYSNLRIILKDGAKLQSEDKSFGAIVGEAEELSFCGKLYGSIGASNYPDKMRQAYSEFFDYGMKDAVELEFKPDRLQFKDDYNFFTPTDGDGSRFKDYTSAQGGTCKPACVLPAKLGRKPFKLIHTIMSNFTKTGMVDGLEFVNVDKARGSTYALLEGLRNGEIPTDRPLVFSWGDNFSDIDISKLLKYHEKNNAGITILGIATTYEAIKSFGTIALEPETGFEVRDFVEKPQKHEEIIKSAIPGTDKYLASVGPFVLSCEVLNWIKENYTKNPDSFYNPKLNAFDFSSSILEVLDQKMKNGEIKDKNGNKMPMMAYIKPDEQTWSDIGKTKYLISEMKRVKEGEFSGLPSEVKETISQNVDEAGIITLNQSVKALFNEFCKEYNLKASGNIVVVENLG